MLGAAITLVALAVGVVSPAWGSSGNKETTFRLLAVTTELKFPGMALGDQIVFTNKLLKGET